MLIYFAAALLQVGTPATSPRDSQPPALTAAQRDSARARRIPVTPELLRTAFDDQAARSLLQRARDARMSQDSSIVAYDATAFQRISAGLGIRRFGRERLLFRREEATRVRWQRGEGAVIDVLGSRSAAPNGRNGLNVQVDVDGSTGSLPYYPGQETLWIGSELAKREVNDREVVHPLAVGSEAYYRYSSGDSVTVRLQNGRTIQLRELRVRPREPKWNLAVGSLWFDTDNAQLVRAVYRLSVPIEIWDVVKDVDDDGEDVPGWVKAMVNPLRATVTAVTVEYGLEAGRFWLPRLQAMEANAEVAFMRVPVRFEQTYRYASVNAELDSLPAIPTEAEVAARRTADSLWRDSVQALPAAQRDSARKARRLARRSQCDSAEVRQSTTGRFDGALPVLVRIPCDTAVLVNSAALPGSIYEPGEQLFDQRMQDALVDAALSLSDQAHWSPQPPVIRYGWGDGLLRYNRVEGLSPAVSATAQLGAGYTALALARIGVADWQPNAELSLSRSDGRRTLGVGVYRRLAAANDWGEPLGLSSSLTALLFGRDEGFYYRSWGAEVTGFGTGRSMTDGTFGWRLFTERNDAASVHTNFAIWNQIRDQDFKPNIAADEGSVTGLGVRYSRTYGVDPQRLHVLTDMRGEGGLGSFSYGRGMADVTLSRPLSASLEGALTVSGGSSFGQVPVQHLFYLGGPQSVRGQDAGAAIGDAYWMTRAELALSAVATRPVLFYDLGWAGDRGDWRNPGRPASGGGVGLSFLQGLFRFDVARGVYPEQQWRVDMYLEARF